MNKEEREQWLSNLQEGDFVAYKAGSYSRYWVVTKILRITPSGRLNLSNKLIINPDGSIRGDKYFYIQPVTEEIRMSVWRDKAIRKVRNELKIESLSNEDLKVIIGMLNNSK